MTNESRTLWVSLAVAMVAVFLLYSWSQEQKTALSRKYGTAKNVVVATKDIPEMTPIDDTMIESRSIPQEYVGPSAVDNPENVIGQLAAAPMKTGEQILDTKLLYPGKISGLSMEISAGSRAMALPIDEMRGVSKLIKPGDRVDVVASLDVGQGTTQKREVRTILQDVTVLSTGANINNQLPISVEQGKDGTISIENLRLNNNFSVINVEVKPDEAQKLVYLLSTSPGSLFVVLRNSNDKVVQPLRTTGLDEILERSNMRIPSSDNSQQFQNSNPMGSPQMRNLPRGSGGQ